MAIKGLTDRGLSFPEIGQIRKGAKKTDNAPGKDLTYFRVEFDDSETDAASKFVSTYGKTPAEIRIVLPFNEITRMWDAWLEGYTAGRMVARSDGEYFTYLIDTQTGEILVKGGVDVKTNMPKPYVDGQVVGYYKDKRGKNNPIFCKPTGRLKVIVPELGRAAYLTVMTTSTHDIANISAQLDAFKTVNNGMIAGIPLILRRRPKKISCPNADGTRARRVKWMLSIEADPKWMKQMLGHLNTLALPGEGEFMALPSGEEVEVTPEEFNEVEEEDYQDGEFTDAEPPEPVQPKPEPKAKAERPLDADTLYEMLCKKADTHAGKTATDKQRQFVAALIGNIFEGDKDKRHLTQRFLLGADSTNDAEDGMILATLDWLKPTKDSGNAYIVDPMAEKECKLAYHAAAIDQAVDAGQEELPLD